MEDDFSLFWGTPKYKRDPFLQIRDKRDPQIQKCLPKGFWVWVFPNWNMQKCVCSMGFHIRRRCRRGTWWGCPRRMFCTHWIEMLWEWKMMRKLVIMRLCEWEREAIRFERHSATLPSSYSSSSTLTTRSGCCCCSG